MCQMRCDGGLTYCKRLPGSLAVIPVADLGTERAARMQIDLAVPVNVTVVRELEGVCTTTGDVSAYVDQLNANVR